MGVAQSFIDFGFNLYGTAIVTKSLNDKKEVEAIIAQITYARAAIGIGGLVIILIATTFIDILSENFLFSIFSYLAVAFTAILPDFVFQSYEKMRALTTRFILVKSVALIGVIVFVRDSDDLYLIGLINFICAVLGYIWTIWAISSIFNLEVNWHSCRHIFTRIRKSALYCFSNISTILFDSFTTLSIGVVLTNKADLAYWGVGITAIGAVQALYAPIMNSLYPHVLRNKNINFALRLGLVSLPVLIIGTIAFIYYSDLITLILGGPSYGKAANVMIWLSPILLISFYGILIGWPVLGAVGEVRGLTFSTYFAGLANVFLMGGIIICGIDSLILICYIRVLIELILLVSRGLVLCRYLKNKT